MTNIDSAARVIAQHWNAGILPSDVRIAHKLATEGLLVTDEQRRIIELLRAVEPSITAHLWELNMDTPEDNALLDRIRAQWAHVTTALNGDES